MGKLQMDFVVPWTVVKSVHVDDWIAHIPFILVMFYSGKFISFCLIYRGVYAGPVGVPRCLKLLPKVFFL